MRRDGRQDEPTPAQRQYVPGGFAHLLRAEWTKFRTCARLGHRHDHRRPGHGGHRAARPQFGCGGQATPGGPVTVGYGCAAPIGLGGEAVTDSFHVRAPAAGRQRQHYRPGHRADHAGRRPGQPGCSRGPRPGSSSRPAPGPGRRTRPCWSPRAMASGCTVRLHRRHRRAARRRLPHRTALAPAGPLRRHGHRVRLGRRHALDHGSAPCGCPDCPAPCRPGCSPPRRAPASPGAQSLTGSSSAGALTLATGHFDHVTLSGSAPSHGWAGTEVGGGAPGAGFQQAGGTFTVTGTGDIAPGPWAAARSAPPVEQTLTGVFGALIAVIVVAGAVHRGRNSAAA